MDMTLVVSLTVVLVLVWCMCARDRSREEERYLDRRERVWRESLKHGQAAEPPAFGPPERREMPLGLKVAIIMAVLSVMVWAALN